MTEKKAEESMFETFVASTVRLEGTNIIEASAGTGKTYSIAILALRLIVEKGMPITKILMVTFTKAAVEELKERVRLFVIVANKTAQNKHINDETIFTIVANAKKTIGEQLVQQRLRDAILFIDELSIMTIHSFCQQTLSEFAFETNQVFGVEMFTETNTIIEKELNEFWRRNVTTLSKDVLEKLDYESLRNGNPKIKNNRGGLFTIVSEQLSGKRYAHFDESENYSLNDIDPNIYIEIEKKYEQQLAEIEEKIYIAFNNNYDYITEICKKSKAKNKKEYIERLDDAELFIEFIKEVKSSTLFKELTTDVLKSVVEYQTLEKSIDHLCHLEFRRNFYCFALQEITKKAKSVLVKNTLLTYDDLIRNLYTALAKPNNNELVGLMQEKYKAVFVDEFQDTDKEQYQIFNTAFSSKGIIFYIGDPKQSIYAWRKADLFTYFEARANAVHRYSMNTNYRSNENLIAAMNQFFLPEIGFDTFAFEQANQKIEYLKIDSPQPNAKGKLLLKSNSTKAISIATAKNKEDIINSLVQEILNLTNRPEYEIENKNGRRKIKTSDIGILVRKNQEGIEIKEALNRKGVAASILFDSKVLQTSEAKEILYVLEAIQTPNKANINRALMVSFSSFDGEQILNLDEEKILFTFQELKTIWANEGVYPALVGYFKHFNIAQFLLSKSTTGEGKLGILYQLSELLHQIQYKNEWNIEDTLDWLKRSINSTDEQNDAYLLAMESDEDGVKIITIHKSKGLEYNIVFAPFLDFTYKEDKEWVGFRSNEGLYLSKETKLLSEEELKLTKEQIEQENRRLIYVAITRAAMKCYVYKNTGSYYSSSSLLVFFNALKNIEPMLSDIEFIPATPIENFTDHSLSSSSSKTFLKPRAAKSFELIHENWYKLSYTRLSAHQQVSKKERSILSEQETYDHFIFHELNSGATTGNLLHDIFENIDFGNDSNWQNQIEKFLNKNLIAKKENTVSKIAEIIKVILNTEINCEGNKFKLSAIPFYKKITELEFDFPIENLNYYQISNLSKEDRTIATKGFEHKQLEGIMNGMVDLFFEHEDKYYLLDWKSNYLGNKISDYDQDSIKQAMSDNNYHLQYLIYTVAIKKYLESRLPYFSYEKQFGGVIYLFLRGIRQGSNSGIFTTKPSIKEIFRLEKLFEGK